MRILEDADATGVVTGPIVRRDPDGDVGRLLSSPTAIRELPTDVAAGVVGSVEVALQAVFWWAVPMLALGFVLAWFLREIPLRDTIGPNETAVEATVG